MRSDWPANADVICTRFECLARRHESFLIARLCPGRANSLNSDLDFVAELRTQLLDFMRTDCNAVDSCCDTQPGESQNLFVHFAGYSDFAHRLFRRAR